MRNHYYDLNILCKGLGKEVMRGVKCIIERNLKIKIVKKLVVMGDEAF